jgi:hypothetical protein
MTMFSVTAWCEVPFYALCEVEAETPEEALAKARELIPDEPAEPTDHDYCWDEWRVDSPDTEGDADGLLLILDEPAKLRNAAAKLLEALRSLVEATSGYARHFHEHMVACAVIAEATSGAHEPRLPIIIEVRGGVVQDVLNVPPGVEYEIRDHDNQEETAEARRDL